MNVTLSVPGDADGLGLQGTVAVHVDATPKPLRIELYVDGALLGSTAAVTTADYQWDTTRAADGTHKLLARAVYKSRKQEATSAVTVANAATGQPPPPPAESPDNTVVVVGHPGQIVGKQGHTWEVAGSGQVVVDGATDPITSGVNELAYEGGKVWQRNTGGLWWYKVLPADQWLPTGGTPTSPVPGETQPPPPVSTLPKQGISVPVGNVAGKSAADQDWFFARVVELGAGHRQFLRSDYFVNSASWNTVAAKAAANKLADGSPAIVMMPILSWPNGSKPTPQTYTDYCKACAQQGYTYINLLNEPDMSGYDPKVAAAYVASGIAAILAVNPAAKPIVGSTWKTSSQKVVDGINWDKAYIAELGRLGAKFAYYDKHLYGYVDGDRSWNNWPYLPDLRAALDAAGYRGIPIMSTEMGDKAGAVGVARQDDAVLTGFGARAKGYVAHGYTVVEPVASTLVYSVFDDAEPGGFGLYDGGRNPRPAVATAEAHAQ